MTKAELSILISYLDNALYLIQRTLKTEKNEYIKAILLDQEKNIQASYKRFVALQKETSK